MKKLTLFIFLSLVLSFFGSAQNFNEYTYKHVPIGAGGYTTGVLVHPSDSDVRYYRTDVGGIYRFNSQMNYLEQLVYSRFESSEFYSVAGIALDANDKNKLIVAAGRNCNPDKTAIMVSTDQGSTFTTIKPGDYDADIYFAANGGRDCSGGAGDKDREGNCIALNPNNSDELFIGSRGTGLWKLKISTNEFTQLGGDVIPKDVFPNSIRNVLFHPTNSSKMVVGFAGQGIFLVDISGADYTYEKISSLSDLEEVSDISISKDGDYLLVACREKGIYKCSDPFSNTREWELVKEYEPEAQSTYFGFLTVTCSPHDNDTAMTINGEWGGLDNLHTTTDAGGNWSEHGASFVENIFPYKKDNFGSHASQIAFDPEDDKKLYLTSWFSPSHTDDWTQQTIEWRNSLSRGHEEIVVTDLVPFPTNSEDNFLMVASADHSGFVKKDLNAYNYPTDLIRDRIDDDTNGTIKGSNHTYCFTKPDYLYAITQEKWDDDGNGNLSQLSISSDGGVTFQRKPNYPENDQKSHIAVSPTDETNLVILNKSGALYSKDLAASFTQSTNVSGNNPTCNGVADITPIGTGSLGADMLPTSVFNVSKFLASDKVLPCVFYIYNWIDGSFNVSTDGGESFFKVYEGLPSYSNSQYSNKTRIETIPGHSGHITLNFKSGLYLSEDYGQSWTKLPTVYDAFMTAVGKQITIEGNIASYPSIFLFGKLQQGTAYSFYRSDDKGVTWNEIYDAENKEFWGRANVIAADMNIDGRFYIGTGGGGVFYGDSDMVLPLSSIAISAQAQDSGVRVEIDFSHPEWVGQFEIQKSLNGIDYFTIYHHEEIDENQFEYIDKNYHLRASYYRVKVFDFDQQFKYSHIAYIHGQELPSEVVTFFTGNTLITLLPSAIEYKASLFDVSGKLVDYKHRHDSQVNMNVENLSSGFYILQIIDENNEKIHTKKVIIP